MPFPIMHVRLKVDETEAKTDDVAGRWFSSIGDIEQIDQHSDKT